MCRHLAANPHLDVYIYKMGLETEMKRRKQKREKKQTGNSRDLTYIMNGIQLRQKQLNEGKHFQKIYY